MKLTEADISAILDDCKAALEKVRLDDFEKEQLFASYSKMLTEYRDHFGEDTEIRYRIRKRLVRLESVLSVKGEKWNPFLEERDAEALEIQNKVHPHPSSRKGFAIRNKGVSSRSGTSMPRSWYIH